MTLHAAKGLEWPVCFVIGCQDGILPHQRTVDAPRGDISEERRLFYVGITRARRACYLSLGKVRRGMHGPEPQRPSRFLKEIPDGHLDRLERSREPEPATKEAIAARFADLKARLAGGSKPG